MGRKDNGANNNSTSKLLNILSFIRSGYYSYGNGEFGNHDSGGYYWSHAKQGVIAIYATHAGPQNGASGFGFALRCLAR